MAVLALVATLMGWWLGNYMGGWYSGHAFSLSKVIGTQAYLALFVMTLCIGVVASYHYYVQGKREELARQLEASQRQSTQAQLMLLQSQLEPHMLFNTLANLRALINVDKDRALQMLDRLNDFLRSTLGASRTTQHPLSAEFERLSDYLYLMGLRMGDRLRVALDLPDDLRDQPVPTLLLQALVENAIKHGLEPSVSGGSLSVQARRENQHLVLEVADTGVGIDPAALAVANSASLGAGSSFGLSQVRERLATAYGAEASLELLSLIPNGILARVRIPLNA